MSEGMNKLKEGKVKYLKLFESNEEALKKVPEIHAILAVINAIILFNTTTDNDRSYENKIHGIIVALFRIICAVTITVSEFTRLHPFYLEYLYAFMHPIGRTLIYLVFAIICFNYSWWGITSTCSIAVLGITTLLLNYNKGYNKSPYINNKLIKDKLNSNNESTINRSLDNSRSNSNIDWNNDITPTDTIATDELSSNESNNTQVNIISNMDFENIELPEYSSITFPIPAAPSSSITFINSVPSAPTSSIIHIPSAPNSLSYIDSKQSNNVKNSNF